MYDKNLQYSTIQGHVTALSYFHKIKNVYDPTQTFYISKLLGGISKRLPTVDSRCAIDREILCKILPCLPQCTSSTYESVMFTSMFLLAYHVCLRVGELCVSNSTKNIIKYHQVSCATKGPKVIAYLLRFEHFKHSTNTPVMRINQQPQEKFCPVDSLTKYLHIRGKHQGPLFLHHDNSHVTRQQVAFILDRCLEKACYNPDLFGTHSFRIGKCTDMARAGLSESHIKLVGRWKSDAFKRYIRPSVVQL